MSDRTNRMQAQESRGFPPVGSAHRGRRRAPKRSETLLHIEGFGGGVPLNTETAAVNPRAGIESIARRCLFFVEMAWAGSTNAPGPFNFRGCDLTAEWLLAREPVRVQLPATAPMSSQAARQLAQPSPQNSVRSGQHRGGLPRLRRMINRPSTIANGSRRVAPCGSVLCYWQFAEGVRGRGRQVMHLPCKQVDEGAIPSDSTISLRGE
jgi:hypothetical protein